MTEAEFERRLGGQGAPADPEPVDAGPAADPEPSGRSSSTSGRIRASRSRAVKPRRVQRMFAIEEDVDKKLWLYAIHMGKDRSEVVNDLLRPVVASMVLYDSRDRRSGRSSDSAADRGGEAEGDAA
jgi:hypothetical protein